MKTLLIYRTEGKNNVYILKKSIEGRNAAMIADYTNNHALSVNTGFSEYFPAHTRRAGNRPGTSLRELRERECPTKTSDIDIYIDTLNLNMKKQRSKHNSHWCKNRSV